MERLQRFRCYQEKEGPVEQSAHEVGCEKSKRRTERDFDLGGFDENVSDLFDLYRFSPLSVAQR